MKKKLMATLLALALVMSLVPTVFATDPVVTYAATGKTGCIAYTPGADGAKGTGCVKITSTPETGDPTVTEEHAADCLTKCTNNASCPNSVNGNHKSTCPKAKCVDTDCKNSTPHTVDSASHQYACACKATHDASHTGTASTKGGVCATCASTDACKIANATSCTGNDPANARCSYSTHADGCPMKCTVTACTKTKTHTDKHMGTACTGDSRCPVDAADDTAAVKHDAGCDSACPVTGCTLNKNHAGNHNSASCTNDSKCNVAGSGSHEAGCPNKCNGETNCTAQTHATNACKSLCKMSASCTNTTGHHKDNCIKLCTYDPESEDPTNGLDCPNTSGDPTLHVAGCPKANVADSVVLNPDGTPAESTEPGTEPTAPVEITKAEDFTDVTADDWYAEDLTAVIEKGWVKGNEDGSFDPEGNVSGQQAVVFVSRMLDKGFNTEGENWAEEATKWAAEDGLTEGIEITSEGIARKDLILLLWRAAGKQPSDHEVTFSDVDELEGDYLTALKWAVENSIILGNDDGTFTPAATTTRSQITAILVRYDKAVNK